MPDSRGTIRPYQTEVDVASRLIDLMWISVALWIACLLCDEAWQNAHSLAAASATVLFYLFGEASGLYRPQRGEPVREEVMRLVTAWAAVVALLLFAGLLLNRLLDPAGARLANRNASDYAEAR
jgi:hypothetical protein